MALTGIAPLTAAECPLLVKYGGEEAHRLIERFNEEVGSVQSLSTDRLLAPLMHASDKLENEFNKLKDARRLLSEPRYAVGCIGITNAGKSTTINNVLGETICKSGTTGDATSSQPSRIAFAETRSLELEYLKPADFEKRRQELCDAIGLGTPEDDDELLTQLQNPESFARVADGQDRPRLKEDIAFLIEFLQARRMRHDLIQDPPRLDKFPFEQRDRFTTHAAGRAGADVLLVREARFHVDNKNLRPDLELCDLPGLGSKRTIDDIVTWHYLKEIRGAFLFVNVAGAIVTEAMLKIFAKLKQTFASEKKLGGRAWLVFTWMDALGRQHFEDPHRNIFSTIGQVLEHTGISESCVVFCSSRIWQNVDPGTGMAEPAGAALTMSQSREKPVPESCPPGLRKAWEDLLKDGGVTRLRHLMFDDVATALASEIRRDVGRKLDEFHSEFAFRIEAERKRLSMDKGELQAANTCRNVVMNLWTTLATRPNDHPILLQEGERLRKSLLETFEQGGPPALLKQLSPKELAAQFRIHARVLSQTVDHELTGESIERIYQVIGQRLEDLPPVLIGPEQRGCREIWQRFTLEERADPAWRQVSTQFANDELAAWIAQPEGESMDGSVYEGLMREKIRVSTRDLVHTMRARLRARLREIAGNLALLIGDDVSHNS